MLTLNQQEKYNRQLLIEEFGEKEQEKLIKSRILVVGAGGLGSSALLYLIAAGVGKTGIVENDKVALHNLNRQILYTTDDLGKEKISLASQKLNLLNPECRIISHKVWWDDNIAQDISRDYELIIDCTDNIESRLTSDNISKKMDIPFVYGAINGWEGQVSVFNLKKGNSYSHTFGLDGKKTTEKKTLGVIGVAAAIVGSIMASEAIKIIIGKGDILSGKLLHLSLLKNQWDIYKL